MQAIISLEHRFERTPDGAVWTQVAFAHNFWERYLEVFDGVRVVARVRDVAAPPAGWKRADGAGVSFAAMPYYVGPLQYARHLPRIRAAIVGLGCTR